MPDKDLTSPILNKHVAAILNPGVALHLLLTSELCWDEARRNIECKRADRLAALHEIGQFVDREEPATEAWASWAEGHVDLRDAHVLAAARAREAHFLITGDMTHFGHLIDQNDLGVLVRTPRQFVLRGEASPHDGTM